MKGLLLSREYYNQVCLPILCDKLPHLLDKLAIGLVGEGSECFGWDDEISQDHSFGLRLCIWMSKKDFEAYGTEVEAVYEAFPSSFLGYTIQKSLPNEGKRSGVFEIEAFYQGILGISHIPTTLGEWLLLEESKLATATSGEVFQDPLGEFTAIRKGLLAYYPEDVRLHYIAQHAIIAAQTGQYNLTRCRLRKEHLAAYTIKGKFMEHIVALIYLCNQKYRPFYKWAFYGMQELSILQKDILPLFQDLVECKDILQEQQIVEDISGLVIQELRRQNITTKESGFLLDHCADILQCIQNQEVASKPLHL